MQYWDNKLRAEPWFDMTAEMADVFEDVVSMIYEAYRTGLEDGS